MSDSEKQKKTTGKLAKTRFFILKTRFILKLEKLRNEPILRIHRILKQDVENPVKYLGRSPV
jgi:hypothetical protein